MNQPYEESPSPIKILQPQYDRTASDETRSRNNNDDLELEELRASVESELKSPYLIRNLLA